MNRPTSYTSGMRPSPRELSATARALLITAALVAGAGPQNDRSAYGQQNPYGDIDPSRSSVSLLKSTVGLNGSPNGISMFDRLDPDEVERLFVALLDHPDPGMRTMAGVSLVKRGEDPLSIARRMDSEDATGALVLGMVASKSLEPDDAIALVDTDLEMSPIARTLIRSIAGRASDLEFLTAVSEDPEMPSLARGIAAATLEKDVEGSVAAWLQSMDGNPEPGNSQRDRTLFELIEIARSINLEKALVAIEALCRDRSPDDGIRAASVLALMEVDPDRGTKAWLTMANAAGDAPSLTISIALLLLAAEAEVPAEWNGTLPTSDPLQTAIRSMVMAAPADRPDVAIEAIRRGHVPTMRWFLELPDQRMPVDSLEAIIERGSRSRRPVMIDPMTRASEAMGRIAPERLVARLEQADADGNIGLSEIMLRGLVAAGSEPAAAAARNQLDATRKATRSMALLAIASGSEIDEDPLRRQLGRIASGGGDLPADLRPLAAWQHLRLSGGLDEYLPQITAP